jgi:hypothetical protein
MTTPIDDLYVTPWQRVVTPRSTQRLVGHFNDHQLLATNGLDLEPAGPGMEDDGTGSYSGPMSRLTFDPETGTGVMVALDARASGWLERPGNAGWLAPAGRP